jgi:hypothetical protein
MDINHPWTKYELARLRDEERLLRARAAMRAVELREDRQPTPDVEQRQVVSLLDRILRRGVVPEREPARSET